MIYHDYHIGDINYIQNKKDESKIEQNLLASYYWYSLILNNLKTEQENLYYEKQKGLKTKLEKIDK